MKDRICIGVQVSKDTHSALTKYANEKEITVSAVVRLAINNYLKKYS